MYKISEALLNNIINYLGNKPYAEVVNLINAISVEIKENKKNLDIQSNKTDAVDKEE